MMTLEMKPAEGETTDPSKIREVYPGCTGCPHAVAKMVFAGNGFMARRDCPVQGENMSPTVAARCQNSRFTRMTERH